MAERIALASRMCSGPGLAAERSNSVCQEWPGHRGHPLPLRSHGPHSYVFQLFALDQRLGLPDRFALASALHAMAGHVVGRARLDGTYEIR